jgi:hypothetical protein
MTLVAFGPGQIDEKNLGNPLFVRVPFAPAFEPNFEDRVGSAGFLIVVGLCELAVFLALFAFG